MKLGDRFRVVAYADGKIEDDGVQYHISGRGKQIGIESFEVSFKSQHGASVDLWCMFESRLVRPTRFTCKINVGGIEVKSISDTAELTSSAREAVESAFAAVDSYLVQLNERSARDAKRDEERKRSALDKL